MARPARPKASPLLLEPRLPDDRTRPDEVVLEDDTAWDRCTIHGDCAGAEAVDVDITESKVVGTIFTGARVERLRVTDAVFEGCDLSGVLLESAVLARVTFRSCRMLGFIASGAKLRDVRFEDCRLDGANLRMCRGERVGFESSGLRDADLYEAHLIQAHLFDCDLTGAQLSKARLPGARLHGSTLDGIRGADSLRGVVIDSAQVVPLALRVFGALGIAVDDDRDLSSD